MANRDFRFGVVATPRAGAEAWQRQARRYAELGYTSLLTPDGTQLPSPFVSLATAAAVADLTVGTFVAAAPLRPPALAAWDVHTLGVLTGGRFEFGIGAGHPGMQQQVAALGRAWGTPGERIALVGETIDAVRALDGDGPRTRILMACGGPRSRAMAAERADVITFATQAIASREQVRELVADVRNRAGERADDLEFATNLFVVGDDIPEHVRAYLRVDVDEFRAADTMARLSGTPVQMADELRRRRDELGVSYVTVGADFAEQLAPVLDLLR